MKSKIENLDKDKLYFVFDGDKELTYFETEDKAKNFAEYLKSEYFITNKSKYCNLIEHVRIGKMLYTNTCINYNNKVCKYMFF